MYAGVPEKAPVLVKRASSTLGVDEPNASSRGGIVGA